MIRVTRHAIIVSDEGNRLHGGVKAILRRLGIFDPVYRLIFRRPPRTERRLIVSEEDGPAFDFSTTEVLPLIRRHFQEVRCHKFYQVFGRDVSSAWFPATFARQMVVIARAKRV
ncbi:MAG: hypothetical protein EXS33_01770 [Pedosphaera sp.]|nr:hypothetical protein [Pedosphaera sp.]